LIHRNDSGRPGKGSVEPWHKFDPIESVDYYALAGIFQSTRTMESFKKVARWYENSLVAEPDRARQAAYDRQVARLKQDIQKLTVQADGAVKPGAAPLNRSAARKAELKRLHDELARLEKAAPDMPSALGVSEGTVADAAVYPRGNPVKRGEVVPRRVPAVLAGRDPPAFDARHNGRLELARWLVRRENPLTGRVMVNRIWLWHFGEGIVRTPDNFGRLGEPPDNQPLLDWLAHRFVDAGWSVKALHRLILLSSTYQMSSAYDAQAAVADPQNRLHWRANVRRLEAEAVRDSLLAVSGSLELTMGGSLLGVQNRAYLFDHTSRDATRYDSRRRSLYLPMIRNHLYDVLQLFDATDAAVENGDRATTTVAPQALFLLNSDLVAGASERLAARLLRAPGSDADRVQDLYARAYGRRATTEEVAGTQNVVAACERALGESEPDPAKRHLRAWACLCQVVMAANEFVYVR
jgi:hypothetical protein